MKNNEFDYKIRKTPVLLKPYFYMRPSISAISIRILILMAVQIFFLFVTKSYSALGVIFASTLGALCTSLFNFYFKKEEWFVGLSLLIQGIFIGMLFPENYPVVTIFFISFFVLLIEQYLCNDSINSWINIVTLAVVIGWFIGRQYFPEFIVTSDVITMKNPAAFLSKNGYFPVYEFDNAVTSVLNSTVLYWFKVTLPEGIISLLCDSHSVIPAFRFNLITIISAIFIFSDGAFSSLIPSLFLFVYGLLVRFVLPLIVGGVYNQGDILLAFCTSGTLFTAFFLIQWFGTHPITMAGKVVFGILSGIVAFFIVGAGTSPVGMVYTVLICNVLNLVIRFVEEKKNTEKVCRVVSQAYPEKGE